MQIQNNSFQEIQKPKETLDMLKVMALKKFKQAIRNNDYGDYFKFINRNAKQGVVFGEFSSPYLKELNSDHFSYKVVEPSREVVNKIKEQSINVFSVKTIERSSGFESPSVVALFPEMFVGNNVVKSTDPVFYFIDKFYLRHKEHTQKIIKLSASRNYFKELKSLKLEDFSNWVHLHEYFHRQGSMPIPEFLYEKSSSIGAAFEELRVDLKVMEYCLSQKKLYKTFLLVLSERMFLYPVIRKKGSFDSIASLFIYSKLINVSNDSDMLNKLRQLIVFFEGIENKISKLSSRVDRREKLIEEITPLFNVEENDFFTFNKKELI